MRMWSCEGSWYKVWRDLGVRPIRRYRPRGLWMKTFPGDRRGSHGVDRWCIWWWADCTVIVRYPRDRNLVLPVHSTLPAIKSLPSISHHQFKSHAGATHKCVQKYQVTLSSSRICKHPLQEKMLVCRSKRRHRLASNYIPFHPLPTIPIEPHLNPAHNSNQTTASLQTTYHPVPSYCGNKTR
jgi:hypothetical protein